MNVRGISWVMLLLFSVLMGLAPSYAVLISRARRSGQLRPDLLQLPQHLLNLGPGRRRRVDAVRRQFQGVEQLVPAAASFMSSSSNTSLVYSFTIDATHCDRSVPFIASPGDFPVRSSRMITPREAIHVGLRASLLQLRELRCPVPEGSGSGDHVGVGGGRHQVGEFVVRDPPHPFFRPVKCCGSSSFRGVTNVMLDLSRISQINFALVLVLKVGDGNVMHVFEKMPQWCGKRWLLRHNQQ